MTSAKRCKTFGPKPAQMRVFGNFWVSFWEQNHPKSTKGPISISVHSIMVFPNLRPPEGLATWWGGQPPHLTPPHLGHLDQKKTHFFRGLIFRSNSRRLQCQKISFLLSMLWWVGSLPPTSRLGVDTPHQALLCTLIYTRTHTYTNPHANTPAHNYRHAQTTNTVQRNAAEHKICARVAQWHGALRLWRPSNRCPWGSTATAALTTRPTARCSTRSARSTPASQRPGLAGNRRNPWVWGWGSQGPCGKPSPSALK